jgi:hypothetical protein
MYKPLPMRALLRKTRAVSRHTRTLLIISVAMRKAHGQTFGTRHALDTGSPLMTRWQSERRKIRKLQTRIGQTKSCGGYMVARTGAERAEDEAEKDD